MTPGIAYALTVILSWDAPAHPEPRWFATQQQCWGAAPARVLELAPHGGPVAHVGCRRARMT